MKKAFTGRASGRVQGVGYRYFVERTAKDLDLTGWVRNQPDGTVEFTAAGKIADLDEFLLKLKRGPLGSRVESVDVDWLADVPSFTDFRITG